MKTRYSWESGDVTRLVQTRKTGTVSAVADLVTVTWNTGQVETLDPRWLRGPDSDPSLDPILVGVGYAFQATVLDTKAFPSTRGLARNEDGVYRWKERSGGSVLRLTPEQDAFEAKWLQRLVESRGKYLGVEPGEYFVSAAILYNLPGRKTLFPLIDHRGCHQIILSKSSLWRLAADLTVLV